MNLRNFLLQVDEITGQMSEGQLKAVIHENARLLAEAKRSDYLDNLKLFLAESQPEVMDAAESKRKLDEEFEKECDRLLKEI